MSDDELLTFYFKTSVSGFSPKSYVLEELTPNRLVLVSEDSANNKLRKTFSLTDGYVLEIFDELELAVPSYGSISFFKTFYRNGQKSVDYGTSFSRDHLAFSTSEDAFKDESITFIKTKKNILGTGLDILKNTLLSLFLIKKICKKYQCILQIQRVFIGLVLKSR